MLPNFFLLDLRSSLWAFALFGLFAFVPGYAVGWTADFIGFRHRTAVTRLVLSVPVSIGVSPLLAYLTSRFGSIALTWFAFGVLWLVFVIILIQEPRSFRLPIDKRSAVCALIVAGWLAIGLFSLVDLSWGNRLYYSVVSYDYSLRSAIVSAISRDGIPPSNPYFFPGHAVPIRYHYSWLIPCALVKQMGGSWVTGRHAIIAGTLWCGIGLMALIVLYLRFVHPDGARRIHRRALLGLALLAVTGLDIIPDLALALVRRPWAEPEWWNEQVAAWITSMLWVPHHLGALIAGFTGVLILWHSAGMDTRRWPALCVAAFCLAGCVGESIYVGFAFGAALAVWTLVTLLKGWKRETGFLIGMGLLALVLAAPQFWELTASVPGGRTTPATIPAGTHILGLGVRHFYPVAGLARASGWPNLVYAAFLPFNYTLEFGFYGLVGVWFLRRAWRRRPAGRYDLLTLDDRRDQPPALHVCAVDGHREQRSGLPGRAVGSVRAACSGRWTWWTTESGAPPAGDGSDRAGRREQHLRSRQPAVLRRGFRPHASAMVHLAESRSPTRAAVSMKRARPTSGSTRCWGRTPSCSRTPTPIPEICPGPSIREQQNRGGYAFLRHGSGWRSARMRGRSAN
jgi:hypothetical protein